MHSTPNDHIYNLPMGLRVENGVKYRQQMKAVNYTRPEPKSGLNNTVNRMSCSATPETSPAPTKIKKNKKWKNKNKLSNFNNKLMNYLKKMKKLKNKMINYNKK